MPKAGRDVATLDSVPDMEILACFGSVAREPTSLSIRTGKEPL